MTAATAIMPFVVVGTCLAAAPPAKSAAKAEPEKKAVRPSFEGKTLDHWIAQLREKDAASRQRAISALQKIGSAAIPDLVAAVTDKERDSRFSVVKVLLAMGPEGSAAAHVVESAGMEKAGVVRCRMAAEAGFRNPTAEWLVPLLTEALQDSDKDVRAAGLTGFQRLCAINNPPQTPGIEFAVPTIAAMIKDEDPAVRRAAVQAVGSMGAQGAGAVKSVAGGLKDEDREVAVYAAAALGRMGAAAGEAVPALMAALDHKDKFIRYAAAPALVGVDPNKTPDMIQIMKNKEPGDRICAADALSVLRRVPRESADAVGMLSDLCRDDDFHIRIAAAYNLGLMGPAAKTGLSAVLEVLADSRLSVRMTGAFAAAKMDSSRTDQAIGLLIEGLRDVDRDVRVRAAGMLTLMGPAVKSAVPVLREIAANTELGREAETVLRKFEPRPALKRR